MRKYKFCWVLYWKFEREKLNNVIWENFDRIKFFYFWNKGVFIIWETNINSSIEIVNYFKNNIFSELLQFDISIETEDKIWLRENVDWLKWKYYRQIRFIWERFEDIFRKYKDQAVSIREAEEIFGYRSIKVDFID